MADDFSLVPPQKQLIRSLRRSDVAATSPDFDEANFPLSPKEIEQIFYAKCEDFGLKPSEKVFGRFKNLIRSKSFHKVFSMESFSLGPKSANVIKNIITSNQKFPCIMLAGNNFGDEGAKEFAEIIEKVPGIIYMDLSANSIQDQGMAAIFSALRKSNNVYSFSIGSKTGVNRNSIGTKASVALSNVLAENKVLTELDLTMVEITSESVKVIGQGLAKNRFLSELNLTNNNIQSKGLIYIIPCLVKCNLKVLKLAGNHLQDDCGVMFAAFLRDNVSIESIDLSNNGFTSKFISAISNSLATCKTIKELNLSKNPLSGRGAAHLQKVLSMNTHLKYLNLQACKIDINGISQMADGLYTNTSLTELVLSNNPLRDEGVVKLAGGLMNQKGLKKIFLELVEMGDKGSEELLNVLSRSPTLTTLSMKNNLIKEGAPVVKFAQKSKSIKHLFIEYNDISVTYLAQVDKLMKENIQRTQAEKEAKIRAGTKSISEIEDDLQETREMIKLQRDALVSLKKQLVVAKKESEDTKLSKTKTVSILEIRDKGCDMNIRNQRQNERDLLDDLEGKVSIEKQLVDQISGTINGESEKNKNDLTMMSILEKNTQKISDDFENEKINLEEKMRDAISRYKDAVNDLKEAFRRAKEGPKTPVEVKEIKEEKKTEENPEENKETKDNKEADGKKAKKGKKKGKKK